MIFNPIASQTNRIEARLQKLVGSATGAELDHLMIRISGGKRYQLEVEFMQFMQLVGGEYDKDQFKLYNEIQRLLDCYRYGKDVSSKLSSALTVFIKNRLPYSGIGSVIFNDVPRDWPCITIVFHNIKFAYNFGLWFDGCEAPREYSVTDIMKSETFRYSLVPEFNRNHKAAANLGLSTE